MEDAMQLIITVDLDLVRAEDGGTDSDQVADALARVAGHVRDYGPEPLHDNKLWGYNGNPIGTVTILLP